MSRVHAAPLHVSAALVHFAGIMVTRHAIAAACILLACGSGSERAPRTSAPRTYVVRDSAEWDCYGNGGYFGALYDGEAFIDTVDLAIGVIPVSVGVIFAPFRADSSMEVMTGCPQEPVLREQGRTRPLRGILPLFDGGLPAMASDSGALLYWGIAGERVYAMRYAWNPRRLDSTMVSSDPLLLATDNRFQLEPPVRVDSEYRFSTAPGDKFVLDRNWRVVRVDSSAR